MINGNLQANEIKIYADPKSLFFAKVNQRFKCLKHAVRFTTEKNPIDNPIDATMKMKT